MPKRRITCRAPDKSVPRGACGAGTEARRQPAPRVKSTPRRKETPLPPDQKPERGTLETAAPLVRLVKATDMGFNAASSLPNVGKSPRFNALTESAAAQAANILCTIGRMSARCRCRTAARPVGGIASPQVIARGSLSSTSPVWAGGASKGEGSAIVPSPSREVDAVAYVVRCFEEGTWSMSRAAR